MKKQRKKLSLLLAAVMVIQSLSGCSPAKEVPKSSDVSKAEETVSVGESQKDNGKSEGQKTELKWAVWSADTQPYWRPIAEEYMKQNPDISIELVDLGATDYSTALATQLAGNDSPFDIVAIKDSGSYISLISKGILKELDKDKIEEAVYGETLKSLTWQDQYYTLPLRSDFYVMFYNKGVFDKAGVPYPTNDMTFEEYDEMAKKLTDTTFGSETYGSHYHTWNFCVQGMAAVGEGRNSLDGDYDYMKPYYEMVLNQQNNKVCMDYSTLKTSGLHYMGAFGQGNVGTMLMGTWAIGTLITRIDEGQYPDLGEWAVAAYPHKEGGEPGNTLGNFVGVSVVKSSKNAEAAEDFVRFAGGPEGAKLVAEKGYMPGAMSDDAMDVIFSVEGFPVDEQSKEAILGVKKIYLETPIGENCPEIDQVLNTGHDYIMTGAMTVDEGIAYMNDEVGKLIK
ncbi:ABC transporter substrate-binding protein [Clostridium sp. chh4-2]|uniref:ABC transporter substrate-binding protein n=1 Tax=Clostridium sp. chh4-2 TaxID=2067550 RepID=UPI000CCF8029|nr:extracellular solute-binding protein [Clostridium sp. chh4-2]PNV62511.1 ABC transporter substrate-binding protein [Clostridium sp. chh4-2]